jgi:micrococcal nuclease
MSAKGWVVGLALIATAAIAGCGGPTRSSPASGLATSPRDATPHASEAPASVQIGGGGVRAIVTRVVDGDTIHATLDGVDEKVRIIGLDSPETDKPGTPVECFAREATAAAKRLLPNGTAIRLQADPTQDSRDRYGRLLAHVILPDGRLFAEVMVESGFATYYVYGGVPSIYADRLAAAQDRATAANAGLWAPTTCAGDGHAASAPP